MRAKEFIQSAAGGITNKVKSMFQPRTKTPSKTNIEWEIYGYGNEQWVRLELDGKLIGKFTFRRNGDNLEALGIWVEPSQRGKGITKMVYDKLKSKGFKIHRSQDQTDDGKHFWDKNRPGSPAGTVWEQNMTERKSL